MEKYKNWKVLPIHEWIEEGCIQKNLDGTIKSRGKFPARISRLCGHIRILQSKITSGGLTLTYQESQMHKNYEVVAIFKNISIQYNLTNKSLPLRG